jgi:hypothetical protein
MVSAPARLAEEQGMRRRAQIGNRVYTVIPLALPLTAIRTGTLTLGPFTASAVVLLPASNEGGDPFFGRFFNQGRTETGRAATVLSTLSPCRCRNKTSPPISPAPSAISPCPPPPVPPTVTVGDPITVRVQISGRGAFDVSDLPSANAWHDFKTYPPTTKLETSDQFGFQGTKTFEQIVSPKMRTCMNCRR